MKHQNFYSLIFIISLTFSFPAIGHSDNALVQPALNTLVSWDLKPNGLLCISYDLNQNGKADYHTVHFVIKSYLSQESMVSIPQYYGDNPIFFVDYGTARYIYVISESPLYYAIDINEDSLWDFIYIDTMEDGVNGNEKLYDGSMSSPVETVPNS